MTIKRSGAPIIGVLAVILLAGCEPQAPEGERRITSAMSPCQCLLHGGCGIRWRPKGNGLYADGTDPAHYDGWDRYFGPVDVPAKCRKGHDD